MKEIFYGSTDITKLVYHAFLLPLDFSDWPLLVTVEVLATLQMFNHPQLVFAVWKEAEN